MNKKITQCITATKTPDPNCKECNLLIDMNGVLCKAFKLSFNVSLDKWEKVLCPVCDHEIK